MHARAINQLKSNDWSRATPTLLHRLLLVAMIGNALVDGIKICTRWRCLLMASYCVAPEQTRAKRSEKNGEGPYKK